MQLKHCSKAKVYIDQVAKEKRRDEVKVADGIWVTLFPKFDTDVFGDDVVEKFKIYLINRHWIGLRVYVIN